MSSGEPLPNRNYEVVPEDGADAAPPDPTVLEQVLEETVSATSDEPLTRQELDALKAVADRHGPCALDLDPVGIDLIAAMIRLRFPTITSPELQVDMARQIAAACLRLRKCTRVWKVSGSSCAGRHHEQFIGSHAEADGGGAGIGDFPGDQDSPVDSDPDGYR